MRRWLVRLHHWAGLALSLYVALICLTGSVLVFRPELYRAFEPQPTEVEIGPQRLSDARLMAAARRAFPDKEPIEVWPGQEPNHAATVDFVEGDERSNYLFDPFTGAPLGPTTPFGFRATTFLLDLHTQLVSGESGKLVNGALALGLALIALTGALAWLPRKPRERARGLRRWHLTAGIWSALFVLMWGITGLHLAVPGLTTGVVERFAPLDESSPVEWVGDTISYWLAYLHFGRFGGVLPGCERGAWCAEALKVAWSLIALAPVFLAGSGLVLWVRGRRAKARVRRLRT